MNEVIHKNEQRAEENETRTEGNKVRKPKQRAEGTKLQSTRSTTLEGKNGEEAGERSALRLCILSVMLRLNYLSVREGLSFVFAR